MADSASRALTMTSSLDLPRSRRRIFGLEITLRSAREIAAHVLATRRPDHAGVGLIATPNISHIAALRANSRFRAAYAGAEITTCDGFPVYYYARLRGCAAPGRVTGCDIVSGIMDSPALPGDSRFFFVLDGDRTEAVVHDWARRRGLGDRVATTVPPFGFEVDQAFCRRMAKQISDHGTTHLLMAVGAPKSEIFVHDHRDGLPPCWALCIGQAVKIALGLLPRPRLAQRLNLEWLWRIVLEPTRLAPRYAGSAIGFLLAVIEDLFAAPPGHQESHGRSD